MGGEFWTELGTSCLSVFGERVWQGREGKIERGSVRPFVFLFHFLSHSPPFPVLTVPIFLPLPPSPFLFSLPLSILPFSALSFPRSHHLPFPYISLIFLATLSFIFSSRVSSPIILRRRKQFESGGHIGEREPIRGSGGGVPSGVQGQSPWSGGEAPLKLKGF